MVKTGKTITELRSRDWILTIPATGEKGVDRKEIVEQLDDYSSYIGQLEQSESGYLHWQIYLSNKNPIRFSTLKKRLKTAHFEPRKGSVKQAVQYCTKEKTRVSNELPIVKGEIDLRDNQGKRSDLEDLREEILTTDIKLSTLLATNPIAWKFERQCRSLIESRNTEKWSKTHRALTVKVFYGDTSTGKTSSALNAHNLDDIYRVTHYGPGAFDSYDAHEVLILDEFRGQIPIGQLLAMLDPYPVKLPARYEDKQAAFTTVYLISNDSPSQWYPQASEASLQALRRRFSEEKIFSSSL